MIEVLLTMTIIFGLPITVRVIITEIIESLLWMYDIARLLKIINAIRIACRLVQAQAPLDSKYVE